MSMHFIAILYKKPTQGRAQFKIGQKYMVFRKKRKKIKMKDA